MGFTVLGVAHTGITVRDLEHSLLFWNGVLGFEITRRFDLDPVIAGGITGVSGAVLTGAVVVGGSHVIELLQYLEPDGRAEFHPRPCDVGSVHIAIYVDDIEAATAACIAVGWAPVGPPYVMTDPLPNGPKAGARLVYLHDHDGVTLELNEPASNPS